MSNPDLPYQPRVSEGPDPDRELVMPERQGLAALSFTPQRKRNQLDIELDAATKAVGIVSPRVHHPIRSREED